MSWLYSIIFASLVFSSEGNLPVRNFNLTDGNVKQVVKVDETERFEQIYQFSANGKVSVSNINGSITIETWDNPQVKLQYVKTGGSKESLSQVDINIEARQEAFRVETDYGSYNDRKQRGYKSFDRLQVEYYLTVSAHGGAGRDRNGQRFDKYFKCGEHNESLGGQRADQSNKPARDDEFVNRQRNGRSRFRPTAKRKQNFARYRQRNG